MKHLLTFLGTLLLTTNTFAALVCELNEELFHHKRGLENQIAPNAEYRIEGDIEAFFESQMMREMFCLDGENEMRYIKTYESNSGIQHHWFYQYYKGILVESGRVVVHVKDGALLFIHGSMQHQLKIDVSLGFINTTKAF